MLLAVDVGNSNVTVGGFDRERLSGLWRLATDPRKTSDEYGAALTSVVKGKVDAAVYGSVVPDLDPVIEKAIEDYFGVRPLAITPRSRLIPVKVDHPGEVGVDRLLNGLAVSVLYGAPAVVIDFGTATTFDCVSAKGAYVGGAILIGPRLAARALAEHTAKLPQVEIKAPRRIIGKNTVECIQAGLYHGYVGMIERVLNGTLKELGARRARVIGTGGLAPLFAGDIDMQVVGDLTLQGLRLAYEKTGRRR